jgi:predicted nuclease of predicted toxin-antitoxin system
VKLLFDENLSRKLAPRLVDIFGGSTHVSHAGLMHSPDIDIWEHARINDFVLVTADADFYELAIKFGPPPKVIWVRNCNYPMRKIEQILRDQALRLMEFAEDKDRAILILKP